MSGLRASSAYVTAPNSREPTNVDQVMILFQQNMLKMANGYIETQQEVMLAYIQRVSSTHRVSTGCIAPVEQSSNQPSVCPVPVSMAVTPDQATAVFERTATDQDQHTPISFNGSVEDVDPVVLSLCDEGNQHQSYTSKDPESLFSAFIELVSQRTGYPVEMLDLTLDLEADLGIDSIKKVEILSNFRRILPVAMQTELEERMEELAGVRTLEGVADWIRQHA